MCVYKVEHKHAHAENDSRYVGLMAYQGYLYRRNKQFEVRWKAAKSFSHSLEFNSLLNEAT